MTLPVLFLIPARGGSRRIPGKNLRTVAGIPLVAHAARIARAAAAATPDGPHVVVCSTDDPAIAAVAQQAGATILDRPARLATDDATSVDVALDALDRLEHERGPFGWLVLLQPTSPLTAAEDVVAAVAMAARTRRPVVSVTASHPAGWHGDLDADGTLVPVAEAGGRHVLSGAFYVIAPDDLRRARAFLEPGRTIGYAVAAERSVDIDEPHDLLVAEALSAATLARPAATVEPPAATAAADPGSAVRTVTVLTSGRQDWGILRSTCAAIREEPSLRLDLVAAGMHLSARHGRSIDFLRADGFEPSAELGWLDDADGDPLPEIQASAALAAVGRHLRATGSDALLLAGDRLETAAAALAATLALVPIAHLHGGEQTLGAFDDALRHAITKLAHLHLVSNEEHARRVIAMGEDPSTVHIVGTPGLDALDRPDLADRDELTSVLGIDLRAPVVVVTVHPVTLAADPAATARAVTAAMDEVAATYVITLPNVDPGADRVIALLESAASRPGRVAVRALGERRYWGLLRIADAMLGNSSSGIAEAPAIGLPVVNVGERQTGRARGPGVIDVPDDPREVAVALRQALDPGYREALRSAAPSVVDGGAGARIAHIIAEWHPARPPRKPPIRVGP